MNCLLKFGNAITAFVIVGVLEGSEIVAGVSKAEILFMSSANKLKNKLKRICIASYSILRYYYSINRCCCQYNCSRIVRFISFSEQSIKTQLNVIQLADVKDKYVKEKDYVLDNIFTVAHLL